MAMRLARPNDPEQSVLELRSGLQIGAPVAGIHVADAHQDGGADEGSPLLPETGVLIGNRNCAVQAFERHVGAIDVGRERPRLQLRVVPMQRRLVHANGWNACHEARVNRFIPALH